MRKKALRKDFYVEIRKSLNRFISIFLIVAMGVAFYSGIQSAAPDMRYSGDAYFDEHKLMDLKVIGTLGLTTEDVEALRGIRGIAKAEPGYMTDVLSGDETSQQVMRLESITPTLNQLTPVQGRLPEKSGECFVDIEFLDKNKYQIGDKITFYREEEEDLILKRDTFTIVGAGSSPLYISFGRGNTNVGNGEISGAGYILPEDFDSEVYIQIYLEAGGARDLTAYTDAYDTLIESVQNRIEGIAGARCEIRYQEVMEEAEGELADAKKELEDGRKEAESELADAKKELEDGEKELEDGKKELADAKKELEDGEMELADSEAALQQKEQELADARTQLADGWSQLNAGKQELASKEREFNKEYDNGIKKIEQGEKELEAGKEQLDAGRTQYESGMAQYNEQKAQYDSGEAAYAQGLAEYQAQAQAWPGTKAGLEAQRAELVNNQTSLVGGIQAAEAAIGPLQDQQTQAAGAKAGLESELAALEAGRAEMVNQLGVLQSQLGTLQEQLAAAKEEEKPDLEQQISSKQREIENQNNAIAAQEGSIGTKNSEIQGAADTLARVEAGIRQTQSQLDGLRQNLAEVESGIVSIDQGIAQGDAAIAEGERTLQATRTQLDNAKVLVEQGAAELESARKEVEAGEKEYEAGKKELDEGRRQLESGKAQIQEGRNTIAANEQTLAASQAQLDEGAAQLEEGKQQIADAKKEIEDGKKEIEEGEKEIAENEKKLEDGKKEYQDAVKEVEEELADGEDKIADAQEEIGKLKMPEWEITDRSALPENIGYGENADRMRSLGQVFPVLFFLVAALISLTTMTRMVEEERTQIGTMKALGYGKMSIASKYLSYALFATLGGCVTGILVGEKILPFIIVTAYGIMYHHMSNIVLPYNMEFGLIATGVSLVCTMGAAFAACYKELASTPAVLMRPPAPKEGKRVLLERIPIIWNHMSFIWKSTVRNLFRYKKRFFMTIFGIGGSMALMLVGFGLRDSIMDIASLQFSQLQIYDGMIILDSEASERDLQKLEETVSRNKDIENSMDVMMEKKSVKNGKKNWDLYVMVPEETEEIGDFFTFRDRGTGEIYKLGDEGAIITEKIAKELEVKPGDSISFEDEDLGTVEIPIEAVTETYLNHYIYLTPALYEKCTGVKPEFDQILFRVAEEEIDNVQRIGQEFLKEEGALSISYTSSIVSQVSDMLSTLDSVIIVLIISAGMLAFVVLYNLSNININERKRELATIKVLGFYDGEVSAYVYRENILITIIGILLGVVLGIILHRFTITTVEVDATMFGRNINLPSFLMASAFTAGFSVIVNWVMHFKLKKIDMVESLKSVE